MCSWFLDAIQTRLGSNQPTHIYSILNTQEDLSSFQSDIDKISDWGKMNKMTINTKKRKIMRITRKKSPLAGEYNIEGQPLGLFTASDLSWIQHVDRITAKASRVLGLVKRTYRELNDADTARTLYYSLVRPLLEYSCETWNPYTKRNIGKVEAVYVALLFLSDAHVRSRENL